MTTDSRTWASAEEMDRYQEARIELDNLAGGDDGVGTWRPYSPDEIREAVNAGFEGTEPTQLDVGNGVKLLYPGRTHVLYGDTSSCKTWVAMLGMKQEIERGNNVVFIDLEDTLRGALERLTQLGLTGDQLAEHMIYVNPDVALLEPQYLDLMAGIARQPQAPTLAVIDSMTELATLHDLDPNKQTDINKLHKGLIQWFTKMRTTVLLIDHTNKVGGLAGSERKVSGLNGAAYRITQRGRSRFGRGTSGKLTIDLGVKDRGGWQERHLTLPNSRRIAQIRLTSDPDGGAVTAEFPPLGSDTAKELAGQQLARDADLDRRVLEAITDDQGITTTDLKAGVVGRGADIQESIERLVAAGRIRRTGGERRGQAVHHYLADG